MHIAHVHVHVKPGMEDEFVDACVANAASSVLEPDNLRFDVLRSGAFYHLDHLALVPVRPRRRRELHSLRTLYFPAFVSLRPPPLGFNPDAHTSTPFNSTPTFVASYGRSPSDEDPTRFVLIEIYATAEGPAAHKVRSIQKFFTHRSVSTFDRVPFQLTGELFLYGMALRRRRIMRSGGRRWRT